MALIGTFMVGEVVAAVLGSSLALFADAGHMLTDIATLAISVWAARLAARPAQGRWTYGLERAEILSAAANGVTLAAISVLIAVEALQRLIAPKHVLGGLVLGVALLGALVNVLAAWALAKADRRSLNVRGTYDHVLTDLYAFIGTAVAGLVIVLTGWDRANPVASLLVVALMGRTAWGLLRDAGRSSCRPLPMTSRSAKSAPIWSMCPTCWMSTTFMPGRLRPARPRWLLTSSWRTIASKPATPRRSSMLCRPVSPSTSALRTPPSSWSPRIMPATKRTCTYDHGHGTWPFGVVMAWSGTATGRYRSLAWL